MLMDGELESMRPEFYTEDMKRVHHLYIEMSNKFASIIRPIVPVQAVKKAARRGQEPQKTQVCVCLCF